MSRPRQPASTPHVPASFALTRWSVVLAAARPSHPDSAAALAQLCAAYWQPLYAFVRRRGHAVHDAQDLVQSFFARLLETDGLATVDRERGRFRSFLLGAVNHFMANEWRREQSQKRGGGVVVLSLDFDDGERRLSSEPADYITPETIFEKKWALAVLDRAMARLRQEHAGVKLNQFEALTPCLIGGADTGYAEIGARLGMTEAAVKVAVHRLRKRCRELLREEVAETVANPADVDDELRHLLAAMRG